MGSGANVSVTAAICSSFVPSISAAAIASTAFSTIPSVMSPTSKKYSRPPSTDISIATPFSVAESAYLKTKSALMSGESALATTALRHFSSSKHFQLSRFECIKHQPPFAA